jgi:hypothetical protein
MANKIKRSDIFQEEDIFKGIRDSAKKTITSLDTINGKLKETAKTLKSALSSQKLDSTKAIKELAIAIEKANKINQQAVKISQLKAKASQEEAKAQQQLQRIETEKAKTTQQNLKADQEREKLARQRMQTQRQEAKETEAKAKADEKARKEAERQASAYQQLVIKTREQKNASKELGAQLLQLERDGKKGTAQWYELSRAYSKATAEAQKGDAQLKKLDRTVGDNFRNVGNYRSALDGLSTMFGAFGVGFGISNVLNSATQSVMKFEVENSKLAAVLGNSVQDNKNLIDVQRELGRTTAYTASEVASLQVELAKLGFTSPQIEKASSSILKLAGATGSDLARSSEIAGATLRGFGLEATQMTHVADVMAQSFNYSALDLESFAESMKYVAPVAKQAGVSLEETSAMLGVLANQGVKGSQAGTSLRRIFTDMALTGKPVKEALAEITKNGITLTDAFDEVGRTAQTALAIIGNNTKQVDEFTTAMINSNGAVDKMYKTMTDNLQGGVDRLASAWESYILDVNNSTGASKNLQHALDWLAKNLVTILDTVSYLVTLWMKYKIIVLAQIGYNKLLASSFMQTARNIGGMQGVVVGLKGAFMQLGQAIKQNIVGIAVLAIYQLYNIYSDLNEAMNKNIKMHEDIASAQKEVANNTQREKNEVKALFEALKKTNKGSEERKNLMEEINQKYGTTLKNLENEEEWIYQVDQAYKDLMTTLQAKSQLESKRIAFEISGKSLTETEMQLRQMEQKLKGFKDLGFSTFVDQAKKSGGVLIPQANKGWTGESGASRLVGGLINNLFGVDDIDQVIAQYNALGKSYGQMLKDAKKYEDEYNTAQAKYIMKGKRKVVEDPTPDPTGGGGGGGGGSTSTPDTKEYELSLSEINRYLERQIELQEELRVLYSETDFKKQADAIEGVINSAQARARNRAIEGEDPLDFIVAGEMYDENERQIIALYELAKDLARKKTDFEIAEIDRKNQIEKDEALKTLNENYQDQKDQYQKELAELQKADPNDTNIGASKANLNKALTKLDQDYQTELAKITEDNKKRDADADTEKLIAKGKLVDTEIQIEKDKNEKINEYNDKLNEAIADGYKTRGENAQNQTEAELKAQKEAFEKFKQQWSEINEAVKFVTDFFIQQSDRRIEQLEKEREQAEKNYDTLKQLAVNGNIQAQQSLAKEAEIINEKNRLIAKEQKFQQRIKLTASVFDAYSKNVNALKEGEDSSKALGNTIRDISLLTQFISSLPAFEKGTEDTGSNGKGVDGKGGFQAILHPHERVVDAKNNKALKGISNEELGKMAFEYKNKKAVLSMSSVEDQTNTILIEKIDQLTKVIKDKPETEYAIAEVTTGIVEAIKKTKTGNTTVYNKFRVKL